VAHIGGKMNSNNISYRDYYILKKGDYYFLGAKESSNLVFEIFPKSGSYHLIKHLDGGYSMMKRAILEFSAISEENTKKVYRCNAPFTGFYFWRDREYIEEMGNEFILKQYDMIQRATNSISDKLSDVLYITDDSSLYLSQSEDRNIMFARYSKIISAIREKLGTLRRMPLWWLEESLLYYRIVFTKNMLMYYLPKDEFDEYKWDLFCLTEVMEEPVYSCMIIPGAFRNLKGLYTLISTLPGNVNHINSVTFDEYTVGYLRSTGMYIQKAFNDDEKIRCISFTTGDHTFLLSPYSEIINI